VLPFREDADMDPEVQVLETVFQPLGTDQRMMELTHTHPPGLDR
jgi:hypothetical protein